MASSQSYRNLLICSVGNPGRKYAKSRHSIGHTLLDFLIADHNRQLVRIRSPTFDGDLIEGNSLLNTDLLTHRIALFKPFTYMNVSGTAIVNAWQWSQKRFGQSSRLVILHDELDLPVGKLKMKVGGSSKGHNGLKSIATYIAPGQLTKFGIGIGRPVSRSPDNVADYVLSNVSPSDMTVIRDDVYPQLWQMLANLEKGIGN
ncbi:peptidyl-tRNA hydrolase [Lipomyces kononenkoae]|uniref:Peptidyl-tRNA hydrolase n=1 Tax=Lipomyces kononenkoae TaxID=34357 RepID=A0ACC3T5X0_LIPKO